MATIKVYDNNQYLAIARKAKIVILESFKYMEIEYIRKILNNYKPSLLNTILLRKRPTFEDAFKMVRNDFEKHFPNDMSPAVIFDSNNEVIDDILGMFENAGDNDIIELTDFESNYIYRWSSFVFKSTSLDETYKIRQNKLK